MKIVWTVTANLENLDNIEYLLKEWGLKVTLDYEEKLIEIENLLIKNPKIGLFDKELGLGCTTNFTLSGIFA